MKRRIVEIGAYAILGIVTAAVAFGVMGVLVVWAMGDKL